MRALTFRPIALGHHRAGASGGPPLCSRIEEPALRPPHRRTRAMADSWNIDAALLVLAKTPPFTFQRTLGIVLPFSAQLAGGSRLDAVASRLKQHELLLLRLSVRVRVRIRRTKRT